MKLCQECLNLVTKWDNIECFSFYVTYHQIKLESRWWQRVYFNANLSKNARYRTWHVAIKCYIVTCATRARDLTWLCHETFLHHQAKVPASVMGEQKVIRAKFQYQYQHPTWTVMDVLAFSTENVLLQFDNNYIHFETFMYLQWIVCLLLVHCMLLLYGRLAENENFFIRTVRFFCSEQNYLPVVWYMKTYRIGSSK